MAGAQYRLRAGSPMPTQNSGEFVLHSFMAALSDIDVEECVTNLPASSSFIGQGAGLTSASYTQLPLKGGKHFRGQKANKETYVEEGGSSSVGSVDFIESNSVNISYTNMGIVQLSFTRISDGAGFNIADSVTIGGQTFDGFVMNATMQQIPGSQASESGGWYTTNVSMVATK